MQSWILAKLRVHGDSIVLVSLCVTNSGTSDDSDAVRSIVPYIALYGNMQHVTMGGSVPQHPT